jgi:MFS family permease
LLNNPPTKDNETPAVAAPAGQLIASAYYQERLKSAEATRSRAQAAYTIASAVAAAIVAAGVFGDVTGEPLLVQIIGLATFALWLTVACLFMNAVAGSVPEVETGEQPDLGAFARAALKNQRHERETVGKRIEAAYFATIAAMALTLLTVTLALFLSASPQLVSATLSLSPKGALAVTSSCKKDPNTVHGMLNPDKLKAAFVEIKLDPVAGPRSSVHLL